MASKSMVVPEQEFPLRSRVVALEQNEGGMEATAQGGQNPPPSQHRRVYGIHHLVVCRHAVNQDLNAKKSRGCPSAQRPLL